MAREKVLCGKEEIIRVAVGIVDKEGMEAVSVRRIWDFKSLPAFGTQRIFKYSFGTSRLKKSSKIKGFSC